MGSQSVIRPECTGGCQEQSPHRQPITALNTIQEDSALVGLLSTERLHHHLSTERLLHHLSMGCLHHHLSMGCLHHHLSMGWELLLLLSKLPPSEKTRFPQSV